MELDWVRNHDTWKSGPYVIELVGQRRWLLTRLNEAAPANSLVRSENGWIGTSLRATKAIAEGFEQRQVDVRTEQGVLVLLGAAVLVFVGAAGGSGRLSAIVAIAAFGVVLFALSRLIDRLRWRPWETINKTYQ